MHKVTITPEIYTFDIDSGHHVSNITYIRWMEMGRIAMLNELNMSVHEIESEGFAPVLSRTEISYRKPLHLGDSVRIELYLTRLKRVSGTIRFNFFRGDDELVAEAEQDALFISIATQRPYKLSVIQRQRFARFLAQE